MEKHGFITDFGIEKAAEANIPRYGIWKWSSRHGLYEVVDTTDELRDILFSYADLEIIPYFETEKVELKVGNTVMTANGEAIITGVYGSTVRVIPCKIAGIEGFEEQSLDKSEVSSMPKPDPDALESFLVTLPGYPSMQTEAKSKAQAVGNVVARLMEASSTKKIMWHGEWYGEPQLGNIIEKLKLNLEKYVTEAPAQGMEDDVLEQDPGDLPPTPASEMEMEMEMDKEMGNTDGGGGGSKEIAENVAKEIAQEFIQELKG